MITFDVEGFFVSLMIVLDSLRQGSEYRNLPVLRLLYCGLKETQ